MENKKENPVPLMELELRKINEINKSKKKIIIFQMLIL